MAVCIYLLDCIFVIMKFKLKWVAYLSFITGKLLELVL